MKNRLLASFAVLTLTAMFAIPAMAQTADDGTGPTEQPSAPMEMGQAQAPQGQPPQAQPPQGQPQDHAGPPPEPTDAEEGGPSGEDAAKTDQGVARISMIHGDVSTQRGDSGGWSAAILNQPVMTGDKVSTGDGARAELQLDFASIFRVGGNTKANIANLSQHDIQVQIGLGIANFTVSKDAEAEPEIDTPNVSVHPAHHDGVFRIEVRPDGDTLVIVRKGEAQIATPQGSTEVHSGEMATIRGDRDSAQYKISPAPDRDDWDRWNSDRDHMIQNAQSWHHTNRYYTGAEDLDANGSWENVPDYGDVWVPNEPDGWAPYRDGNWTYEPYYGWTWVGYEPWGWAPYHYGRWFSYRNSWAWWPGPIGPFYRPFWAPAYVSFWGWGGGFGFGFGFGGWGGFGWLPIGPCDFYHPWWGGYRGRFGVVAFRGGNFNRFGGIAPLHGGTRFSNIRNIHDSRISRGLSTVDAGRFGAGRVAARAATREQIGGARMMAGNLPVVPSHSSLSASGRAAAPSTLRAGGSDRFFGSVHNVASRPESFDRQTASLQRTMQQNHVGAVQAGGRTSAGESMARGTAMRPGGGTTANSSPSRGTAQPSSSATNESRGGTRPFTPPSSSRTGSENTGSMDRGSTDRSADRGSMNHGAVNRPTNNEPQRGTAQSAPATSRDGFRPFTPPTHSDISRGVSNGPVGAGSEARGSEARGSSGSYWNRTAPSSSPSSSSQMHVNGPVYGGSERGSRPQLDMHQPVVRSPSYGGSRAPGYGGSRPSTPSGGSRPPSYGGGGHAPSSGGSHMSAPSGGGGGGHSSGGGHH